MFYNSKSSISLVNCEVDAKRKFGKLSRTEGSNSKICLRALNIFFSTLIGSTGVFCDNDICSIISKTSLGI